MNLRPFSDWLKEMRASRTTGWRWEKQGLRTRLYRGRKHISAEESERWKAELLKPEFNRPNPGWFKPKF